MRSSGFTTLESHRLPTAFGGYTLGMWMAPFSLLLCPADIDGSGNVNINDLLMVIGNWGATGPNPADITGDGVVDVNDLLAVIGDWGACP